MVDLALAYAEFGWKVFPLRPGSKKPRFRKGHLWGDGAKSATTDPQVIRAMWRQGGANCNIGVATGPVSNLFVIDVDSWEHRTDVDGYWCEPDLLHVLGLRWWPPTMRIATPHGRHVYFRYPSDLSESECSSLRSRAKLLFPGVDHRGAGGYVVGPGSIVDGIPYQFVDAGELVEVPRAVIEAVALLDPQTRAVPPPPDTAPSSNERITFAELWLEKGITLVPEENMYNCPFHDDRRPSLAINTEKRQWFCHGCGEGGGYRALWSRIRPGIAPPGPSGQFDQQTLGVLRRCQEMFEQNGSVGSTGTDVKVFLALLDAAWKRRSLEVGASLRWLGERASCGYKTASDALVRLESQGVIQRISDDGPLWQTGHFRICDPGSPEFASPAQSFWLGAGIEAVDADGNLTEVRMDCGRESPPLCDLSHDAFRWGALSSATRTLQYLEQAKMASAKDIQCALGYKALSTVYRHLEKMKAAGFALKNGSTWIWAEPSAADLEAYARISGTAGRGEYAKARHALDRRLWEEVQARKKEIKVKSAERAKDRRVTLKGQR
jgi:DNA-binding MarR family transcriptional regulator